MKKIKFLRAIIIILILFNMGAIFFFSAQKAVESDKTSDGFITALCKTVVSYFDSLSPQEKETTIKSLSHAVRKAAHMSEYALLGFLCAILFASYGYKIRNFALGFGFSTLYAATDEFHQLFVEGRSGQFSDVCIDAAGALTGVIFAWFVYFIAVRIVKQKNSMKKILAGGQCDAFGN